MDFSLNRIYELDSKCQKVLRSVLKLSKSSSLSCIDEDNIRKADKEDLSNLILSLVDATENSAIKNSHNGAVTFRKVVKPG